MRALVTLLTDFGTRDGFVGAMKGVILARAPDATIVDITHDIPRQDVRAGARALREAASTFPAGAIHVAVVDPGVGTDRRALLLVGGGQIFLGPDNGLLSLAAPGPARGIDLNRPGLFLPSVSRTFHGRDVFASVAGHLAAGARPESCGDFVEDWVRIEEPVPLRQGDRLHGRVLHVDRFGNLVTNLGRDLIGDPAAWGVRVAGVAVGAIRGTFGDVDRGQWLAYIGSSGTLEVAVRDGSAASRLPSDPGGAEVILCPR